MVGQSLESQGITREVIPPYFSVKEAVLPFKKFPGVDPILGPEMKSTGEVMGTGDTFASAFAKAQLGAGQAPPTGGTALLSVRDVDKPGLVQAARQLVELGFSLAATATCFILRPLQRARRFAWPCDMRETRRCAACRICTGV